MTNILEKGTVMWILICYNADPDPGSASTCMMGATTWKRIRMDPNWNSKNSEYKVCRDPRHQK